MAPEPPPTPPSEEKDEDSLLQLTRLPNELLEKIFAHLDLRTWRSIRLVCGRFHRAATTVESFANFRVICKKTNLSSITSSNLPFSQIHIDLGDLGPVPVKQVEKLALKTRKRLKSITATVTSGQVSLSLLQPFLIHNRDTIEKFGSLRLSEIRQNGEITEISCPRLRELRVSFDLEGDYDGDVLTRVLGMTPGLRRLNLTFLDQEDRPMTPQSFNASVLTPLVTFLKLRSTSSPSLTINFASEGQKASIPFTFSALEQLLSLAKSSQSDSDPDRVDLRLENVPFLALPTLRDVIRVEEIDPDILDRLKVTVLSVVGTTTDLKHSTMEIERDSFHSSCRHLTPATATFTLFVHLPTGNKIYLTSPSQLLPNHIQNITIVSQNTRSSLLLSIGEGNHWTQEEEQNQSFIEDLLASRDGLRELRIISELDKMELPFLTQDSVNFRHFSGLKSFPNLSLLHLDDWGRVGEDFVEIWGLRGLKELVLRRCYRLTDDVICGGKGGNKASLVQLKNLKTLVLDGYWSITDVSFVEVFSQLPLERLEVWDDPEKKEESITMKAVHILPNSPCGGSLQHLRINKPTKCSMKEVKKGLVKCRGLKKVEVVGGRGSVQFIVF